MSEERIIRINKVLRELNISLERAVDYLKDKGIVVDANPNAKISDSEFNILQNQFAGDKGNKEASKGVGEEIRKEKEALRLEREKEAEDKKRHDDEERQRLEIIKAKASTVAAPKQVGTIDLNPKAKPAAQAVVEKVVEVKPEIVKPADVKADAPSEAPVEAQKEISQDEIKTAAKVDKSFTKADKSDAKPAVVEPGSAANAQKAKHRILLS